MVRTVEPETVHTGGVSEANDTGSPEDADADKGIGSPAFAWDGGSKVIVCDLCPAGFTFRPARFTGNDCVTGSAGAQSALPPWDAVIMQAPAATVVTVEPDTAHTAGVFDANDTGNPELADADRLTGSPTCVPGGGMKVIVCAAGVAGAWDERCTPGAGAELASSPPAGFTGKDRVTSAAGA
jgi:hypothetical protein